MVKDIDSKRTDFSARTVIGPDTTLRLNEVAVPFEITDKLSYPETVNQWNIEWLQGLVWNDRVNIIDRGSGDKMRRIYTKIALQSKMRDKLCKLEYGDVVHRKLRLGLNICPCQITHRLIVFVERTAKIEVKE